ncbi:MAG: helix-turn-helix domain-containing protein, partial [Bacillota bacterium]|nr:helix-turn-helix domain-containing protein [Bacillota bacterium]
INGAELIKVVKRVGEQIIHERVEKENFERYKREMEENEIDVRRRFFNEIVSGSLSTVAILERGKELGLELSAQYYQIALFKYNFIVGDEIYSNEKLTLSKELNEINLHFLGVVSFDRAIEGIALLIKGDTLEQLEATRNSYLSEVKAVMARYPMARYFGGIGTPVGRLKLLSESFEGAARAFLHRLIVDKSAIINCKELSTYKESEDNTSSQEMLELGSIDIKKAEAFLRNGEADEITFFIEEFLKGIARTSEKSFLFRQYFIINVYITVVNFIKEIGASELLEEEPFNGPESIKEVIDEPHKSKDYIVRMFTIAIDQRDVIRTKRYHRLIEQAKEYINDHYTDDNISLNETAAYVNISPSHFSSVFSREAGKTFIRYLTDLRMNKAKELLKCTDMRCSDISSAVGYKDPHYFSYLFKKAHNCSPMQYRALKK